MSRSRLNREPDRIRGTCHGVTFGWPAAYCTRNGTIEREGKLYCRQHDPGDREENRRKRLEKYAAEDAKITEDMRRRERRRLEQEACRNLSDNDLQLAIQRGGLRIPDELAMIAAGLPVG